MDSATQHMKQQEGESKNKHHKQLTKTKEPKRKEIEQKGGVLCEEETKSFIYVFSVKYHIDNQITNILAKLF